MGAQAKAVEYGRSLEIFGELVAQLMGLDGEISVAELGVTVHLLSKVARVLAAVEEGRAPSDDTWHDIHVYGKMVARIRETGRWP